ncbi:hypothetical protein, partial [Mucilaginibacter lappiensis]|uniref:hypothetical protein n=1 Tax=Mucilaginibacter lappiensis TaxID=354630 RepID=UPI003D19FD21
MASQKIPILNNSGRTEREQLYHAHFGRKLDIPLHMGPSIPTHIGPVIPLQKGPVKKEKVC